jgi:hypothetical protein
MVIRAYIKYCRTAFCKMEYETGNFLMGLAKLKLYPKGLYSQMGKSLFSASRQETDGVINESPSTEFVYLLGAST